MAIKSLEYFTTAASLKKKYAFNAKRSQAPYVLGVGKREKTINAKGWYK